MTTSLLPNASIKDIASLLSQQAEQVAMHLFANGVRDGKHICVGSVNGEHGQSLKIVVEGDKAGFWRDFSADQSGDLVDLWALSKGLEKPAALKEIREYLRLSDRPLAAVAKPKLSVVVAKEDEEETKPFNQEYLRNLSSRLAKSEAAMAYLTGPKRGLLQSTIEHFCLGLSADYTGKDGLLRKDAVTAPGRNRSGVFAGRQTLVNVPGLTLNPQSDNTWKRGAVTTYYSDAVKRQSILFVCEGHKDVWRHWQALSEAKMTEKVLLISSTHGSSIPNEWKNPEFWSDWQAVYLGQDTDEAGEAIAEKVLEYVGREAHRIKVPKEYGKDWTDFWQNGGTIEEFKELLDEAPVASAGNIEMSPGHQPISQIGRFSYNPVDINSAYVNGHLYYPTRLHSRALNEENKVVERLETWVIRSDKSKHRAFYTEAPPGTPLADRVLKLTDGTVIQKEPMASTHGTWAFESINAWLNGNSRNRPLNDLVNDITSWLRKTAWLPYDEDFTVLALTVVVTYVQRVFESVPLIMLNGPRGTGKTQVGIAMTAMCNNGMMIGLGSAASMARQIDETRGFVVLDDLEAIAKRADGKDAAAGEFMQTLKVSYNQKSAVKVWTDMKTGKQEVLDFFGVKLINNTMGTDDILGSRMIRVQTRKMPLSVTTALQQFSVEDLAKLRKLRNELHCWAFDNVRTVDKVYGEVHANKTDRSAEIAAPLRVMAKMLGDEEISERLETALERQTASIQSVQDDPIAILKDAVRNLIRAGYEVATLTHIKLELASLLDANFGQDLTNSVPEWSRPEWLSRQLRSNDFVIPEDFGRKRVLGKNLRLLKFSKWFVDDVFGETDESGNALYARRENDPGDFCKGCNDCPYQAHGCELQEIRLKNIRISQQGVKASPPVH